MHVRQLFYKHTTLKLFVPNKLKLNKHLAVLGLFYKCISNTCRTEKCSTTIGIQISYTEY